MPLAIHFEIFDPEVAQKKKAPYELAWSVNSASVEQLEAGYKLLQILAARLLKAKEERFPDG